jgi:hypothetical protein
MGFYLARSETEMALSIKNLKLAHSLYPSSRELGALIVQCEQELYKL